ncbi:MAG: peptidylprolyl isomerase [Rhodoferax sp.]|nr:peptidylprolyl isomerase [Rhodoferax sp.]
MKIEKNTAVTLRYSVFEATGQLLDSSKEPLSYLHGGYGNTFARIEAALQGQSAGFQTTLLLQPEDAFGLRNEALLQTIPKTRFPPGIKVGGQLEGHDAEGHSLVFTVLKIKGDTVYLDGNHPLAGKTLRFGIQVLDVRAATDEEIAHGHVHGGHGHHH